MAVRIREVMIRNMTVIEDETEIKSMTVTEEETGIETVIMTEAGTKTMTAIEEESERKSVTGNGTVICGLLVPVPERTKGTIVDVIIKKQKGRSSDLPSFNTTNPDKLSLSG